MSCRQFENKTEPPSAPIHNQPHAGCVQRHCLTHAEFFLDLFPRC